MQFGQDVGLIEPGMIAVREFLIGKVNGPAYQSRHAVRRSRDIQRRGQQRQQVDQKRLVRRQRLAVAERRVKGIDGIFRRHPEPVIGRKMLFAFGQVFPQQGNQAGRRRPHVHDGEPRQTGQSGLRDKGEVHGVEENRLPTAHRSYPQINPCGLFGGIGRERHDFAVLSAEEETSFFPRRSRAQRPHADGVLKRRGCDRSRTGRHHAGQGCGNAEQRVAKSFRHIARSPSLNSLGEFSHPSPEQKMSLPFTFPHTGPGAEADAEFHAAHAFQIQRAQGFHSIIETFVVRVCERQNRGQQRLEAHVQAAVFQQEGHAVRQTLVPSRQNAEKVLEGFGRLRHKRHNQRPIDTLSDSDGAPRHHVPLARPELRSEVRVQDVMQFLSFARVRVRQTERQGIAGHKRPPCPVGELRRDAQANVTQGVMRRERPGQQIRLPEGIKNTSKKAIVRVMQGGDGTGNLLTTRKCGHFGHGRVAFLQRRLPQGVGQHGGPRPQHNPACFQSTVAL